MRRLLFRTLALTFFLFAGAHAAEPTAARIDELMHQSGLWTLMAAIAPAFSKGLDDASSRMGGRNVPATEALRQAFATAYSADRLRAAIARQLALSLSADDVDASLVWLTGETGRRLTELEEQSSTLESLRERMETGSQRVKELSPERLAQYTRLVEATHAGEVGATIMVNVTAGLARGFAAAVPGLAVGEADTVRAAMEARRPELVAAMERQQMMLFAIAYSTVSDADVERYVVFVESPVGRRYQAATVIALDKALTESALEVGRLLMSQKAA